MNDLEQAMAEVLKTKKALSNAEVEYRTMPRPLTYDKILSLEANERAAAICLRDAILNAASSDDNIARLFGLGGGT